MQHNNEILSTLHSWPSDWEGLLYHVRTLEAEDPHFWRNLVHQHVTIKELQPADEENYKKFFQRFWIKIKPMITNDIHGMVVAATDGYDVLIQNWLSALNGKEKSELVNNLLDGSVTPLHQAVQGDHLETVKVLLNNSADPTIVDGMVGETVLHIAAANDSAEMIDLLCSHGATLASNGNGDFPIHIAAFQGKSNALMALINQDITQVSVQGREHRTPLFLAVSHREFACAQLLLNAGADANQFAQGKGILHTAAANNDAAMVALLLKHVTDINELDRAGITPLARCVMQKDVTAEMVATANVLIEAGADVNAGNVTPLDFLQNSKETPRSTALKQLLLTHQAINKAPDRALYRY